MVLIGGGPFRMFDQHLTVPLKGGRGGHRVVDIGPAIDQHQLTSI
jgi:hypothetical protein